MTMLMRTFLLLPAVLLMATNAMAAAPMGPMPTVEEANAAFARNPDYGIDGKLEKIEACVPGGWEDTSRRKTTRPGGALVTSSRPVAMRH